jgi:hypothetical protein
LVRTRARTHARKIARAHTQRTAIAGCTGRATGTAAAVCALAFASTITIGVIAGCVLRAAC